jgi:hypothetical protein
MKEVDSDLLVIWLPIDCSGDLFLLLIETEKISVLKTLSSSLLSCK